MLRAIQPRAICLYRIEEQNARGAILAGVPNYRDPVTRLIGLPIPPPTDHDVDAGSLDIPRSDRRVIRRPTPNRDDDVAVRVLPSILLDDASICDILGYIEHCARMVSEARTSRS